MKQRMKRIAAIAGIGAAALMLAFSLFACNVFGEKGTLTLQLTDAPTEAENVNGVFITVNEIQYQIGQDEGNDEWEVMRGFEGPKEYNLLELQGGTTATMVEDLVLSAGQINQIRFILDIPEMGQNPSNPGCYITYSDGTDDEPLFVPSGGNTGYKAVGSFQVPVNGSVEVTADFDVRKAVVVAGTSGNYILKPTIRLVVNDQAGSISGSVTGYTASNDLFVYAYEDGTYVADEATDDPNDELALFPNAVTSAEVGGTSSEYKLWYLAAGTYDLVMAEYDGDGNFVEAAELSSGADVVVESEKNTVRDLDASGF